MTNQTGARKKGNKFKTNMTALEYLNFARERRIANNGLKPIKKEKVRTCNTTNNFSGYAAAVKALRIGFKYMLDDYVDSRFTGRLMKKVSEFYKMDVVGLQGKKSIIFSGYRWWFLEIKFNVRENFVSSIIHQFSWNHSESRTRVSLKMYEFNFYRYIVSASVTHYRILLHLSTISDFAFSEANQKYEPLSQNNTMVTISLSAFLPINSCLMEELVASFPEGSTLSEHDTVIQCMGVEFYSKSGPTEYIPIMGGSIMVIDAF